MRRLPPYLLAFCWSQSVHGQGIVLADLNALAGKALFEKDWVQAPASAGASDGLGPLYSNRSCAACHPGGGRGSSPQSSTLQLDDPVYGLRLHQRALTLVPREARIDWIVSPAQTSGDSAQKGASPVWQPQISSLAYGELHSPVSVRLAPSLHGLGALATVPDSVLLALADPDDRDGNGISGRVAWLEQDAQGIQAGRFGWKASTATLQNQAAQALYLDIGISNPRFPDPWGDCTEVQTACRSMAMETAPLNGLEYALEASQTVLDLLTAYLHSLPVPVPVADPPLSNASDLFQRIGCADCHVPELASSAGPLAAYTDLLLHDMGQGLDDGVVEGAADSSEWRTAPLWSLPPNGPYLHDGRAPTLGQVVQQHGGEAASSRSAFLQLNESERAALIVFLLGL